MTASGEVIFISGAARGIGRSIAEALAGEGFGVALADVAFDEVQAVAAELAAEGAAARAYRLDVCSPGNIAAVLEAAAAELGEPVGLVNNAGIYPDTPALELSEEDWDRVLDVNLKGTFFACQAFARRRKAQGGGGAIVNLASTSAFSARIGAVPYAASKAGVVMLTKGLALEFQSLDLRVNAVAPGLVEVREGQFSDGYRDQFRTMIPRGRIGRPQDIAGAVSFLLSPAADFVNGECLVVDGGFLAGRPLQRIGGR
ncbi:MAG TPA: SDR family NAD(P)-dependent oxidoreductase [Bosea sp. (in: a-proteobacteria)]|jgi:3-oxoacyl-[acyl-carrier protein] reductase|uniref:SDR family NAD(P)-dependent oxidoreductase n=1 Tax=Bosea sp. (in: a-proteobacteria) TaxID=1871050 RepID=UPI002E11782D|nr:SDR family NAD(P)-dependent oxidoreductase [Bosea sp. (in: a-proteobacteria)]